MAGITQNVGKSSKHLAINAAKQMAREPWEILKRVPGQLTGIEENAKQVEQVEEVAQAGQEDRQKTPDQARLHAQSVRQMEALEAELAQIRQMKAQEETKKDKEEGVKENQQSQQVPEPPPQISSRPKRGLLASASWRIGRGKRQTQLQQSTGTSRAEFRKPPSG